MPSNVSTDTNSFHVTGFFLYPLKILENLGISHVSLRISGGCVRMCKVKTEDDVSLHDMYSRLSLQPLESRLKINRLRWYGHVEISEDWTKRCTHIDVPGCQGRR